MMALEAFGLGLFYLSDELHCEEHDVNGDSPDERCFGGRAIPDAKTAYVTTHSMHSLQRSTFRSMIRL